MSQLDPVQIAALEFAEGKQGVGFFIEQGCGKTLIALTEFSFLYQTGKVDRMIVICPNTFKKGWLDDIEKHGFAFDVRYLALVEEGQRSQLAEQASRISARPDHQLRGRADAGSEPRAADLGRPRQLLSRHRRIDPDQGPQVGADQGDPQARRLVAVPRTETAICRYIRIPTGRPQTQGPHDLWGQLRAIGLFRETTARLAASQVMGGWENKRGHPGQRNTEYSARATAYSQHLPGEEEGLVCRISRAKTRRSATTR